MNRLVGKIRLKALRRACLFFGCGAAVLSAQSGPVVSGGLAAGSGGEVSFSIGQVDYGAASGAGGFLLEGLQQPEDSLLTTALELISRPSDFSVTAYPNPTTHSIILGVKNGGAKKLSFRLYTIQGKLVLERKFIGRRTDISIARLASGTYFLNVLDRKKQVKQFKIIKE